MCAQLMTIEPVGGTWGSRAFRICIRWRKIENGRKFKNLRNQRLRNHASESKHFFRYPTPRKPTFRTLGDPVDSEEFGPSGRFWGRPASSRSRFSRSWEEFQEFSRSWEDCGRKLKDFHDLGGIPQRSESRWL